MSNLREADQPIAWAMPRSDGLILDVICPEEHDREPGQYTVPLYAAPQPRKRLTDEEIDQMWSDAHNDTTALSLVKVFARAIEAAVWGEKT
jgi:hypothetical protein